MPSELMGPKFILQYQIIDIRDVAEEFLLSSPFDTDRILAILMRHRNRREPIRRILERIATMRRIA